MVIYQDRRLVNSVQGRNSTSLGRDTGVAQAILDRHQTTAKRKDSIRIATWNVRSMFQDGKVENIIQERKRMGIKILGISEVRWTGAGKMPIQDGTIVYSGGLKHERGVAILLDKSLTNLITGYWSISDRVIMVRLDTKPCKMSIIQVYAPTENSSEEDVDSFYEQLDLARKQCKSQDIIVIMGDLNAKIGKGEIDHIVGKHGHVFHIVGKHGLGNRNERGEKWIEWCTANSQVILNSWFKQHERRLWTWKSPADRTRNQIDYITINSRYRNSITNVKTYPGADCNSDHVPVVANFRVKLKKLTPSRNESRYDFSKLTENDIRNAYNIEVHNRYEALQHTTMTGNERYHAFKDILLESAEKIIPKKDKVKKKE